MAFPPQKKIPAYGWIQHKTGISTISGKGNEYNKYKLRAI
jgi:hypothetical protein